MTVTLELQAAQMAAVMSVRAIAHIYGPTRAGWGRTYSYINFDPHLSGIPQDDHYSMSS
jgi:hypothetical protein